MQPLTFRGDYPSHDGDGTRAPMLVPMAPNQQWSLDFVSDQLTDGRRFRTLTVVTNLYLPALPQSSDALPANSLDLTLFHNNVGARVGACLFKARRSYGKGVSPECPSGSPEIMGNLTD